MTIHANQDQVQESLNWVAEAALSETSVPRYLIPWLLEKGLLTSRVQQHCRQSFQLQVLGSADAGSGWLRHYKDWAPVQGKHREIVMWCDDVPGLYAETIIPAATAKAQPWLKTLGTQPLGERLQGLEGVSRSDFEFTCLPVAPAGNNPDSGVPDSWHTPAQTCLWARRSHYNVQDSKLWVIEVFLSAIQA